MPDQVHNKHQSLLDKLIAALLRLPWSEVIGDAWKAVRKLLQSRSYGGMYEVLEHESTLELEDRGGKRATFKKREKVRYLQDNVIAYQDQAWGDGEILVNYRCSPGRPVDRYRSSHKTYILISRREVKTSILRQLPAHLSDDYVPAFLDGQALGIEGGMAGLFYDIALEIGEALAGRGIVLEPPDLGELEEKLSLAFEKRFLPQVAEALGERVLVLLFDEFEELEMRVRGGELPPTVFAYLRHLMQHSQNVTFIFAGTHHLEELTADYWSILFNIALYKQVDFLDMEAARRLIVEPVQSYGLLYDDLAIDKMLRVTTGHPYFLQLLCHALVNLHNRERLNYITIQDVNHTLKEIVGLGEAHLAFLWAESTQEEWAVLMTLTRLISAGEPGTRGAIAGLLGEYGLRIDPAAVSEVARRLVQRDIVREMGPEADRYEFTVDLMRLWIEETKSLSRVVEEVTPARSTIPAGLN